MLMTNKALVYLMGFPRATFEIPTIKAGEKVLFTLMLHAYNNLKEEG